MSTFYRRRRGTSENEDFISAMNICKSSSRLGCLALLPSIPASIFRRPIARRCCLASSASPLSYPPVSGEMCKSHESGKDSTYVAHVEGQVSRSMPCPPTLSASYPPFDLTLHTNITSSVATTGGGWAPTPSGSPSKARPNTVASSDVVKRCAELAANAREITGPACTSAELRSSTLTIEPS